jgi:hypothetical protein
MKVSSAIAVFQTAADPNGSRGLNLSATSPHLSDIFVTAPHRTIETESLKVFRCFFAEGEIGGTLCMRSHISVHGATTKSFSNSFVFKNEIETEGFPGDITPALGAGGPEFESRRPDHFKFLFFHHLETIVFVLLPL